MDEVYASDLATPAIYYPGGDRTAGIPIRTILSRRLDDRRVEHLQERPAAIAAQELAVAMRALYPRFRKMLEQEARNRRALLHKAVPGSAGRSIADLINRVLETARVDGVEISTHATGFLQRWADYELRSGAFLAEVHRAVAAYPPVRTAHRPRERAHELATRSVAARLARSGEDTPAGVTRVLQAQGVDFTHATNPVEATRKRMRRGQKSPRRR